MALDPCHDVTQCKILRVLRLLRMRVSPIFFRNSTIVDTEGERCFAIKKACERANCDAAKEQKETTEPSSSSKRERDTKAGAPGPSHSQPGPSQSQPEPSHSQPGPSQSQPEPSHSQPGPSQRQPEPSHSQPGPSQSQPEPSHSQPGPSHSQLGASQSPSHIDLGATEGDVSPRLEVMEEFVMSWVEGLDHEDKNSLAMLLCFVLVNELSFTETRAAELTAKVIKKNEKTVRRWRTDLVTNGGSFTENSQGRYQRNAVLWSNEDLNQKASEYIRANAAVKGRPNLTSIEFCKWVNNSLLPNTTLEPGFPQRISMSCSNGR